MSSLIDLRSDTVTKPTLEMRAAMAAAEVGDDVYGEDPTVNLLERRAAEIFGREAALFVPTGTMGNQIAIRTLTQPGQEVIAESRAHILDFEMATTAVFSGCLIRAVPAEGGILTWKHIEPAITPYGAFRAATGLIEIENTANLAGGRCLATFEVLEEIVAGASAHKLPLHLDGARIFNAAVALGVDVKALTRGFDTVMFCLSKGLGAPVGSMLVGSAERMARARVFRKALGGGMRQAGVLAAAGLIALEEGPKRLRGRSRQRALAGRGAGAHRGRVDRSCDGGNEYRDLSVDGGKRRGGTGCAAEGARRAGRGVWAGCDPLGHASRCKPRRLHRRSRGAVRGDRDEPDSLLGCLLLSAPHGTDENFGGDAELFVQSPDHGQR